MEQLVLQRHIASMTLIGMPAYQAFCTGINDLGVDILALDWIKLLLVKLIETGICLIRVLKSCGTISFNALLRSRAITRSNFRI